MDRYTHQIKEGRLPVVYGQSHVDGAAAGVQVAGALSGIGQAVQKFGAVMKRRQDEWDTTRAMEANNEFVKRMTLYMDDPDEGVTHSRKLSLARGVTDAADKDADRFIAEIEAKLENDAQKEAFRSLAERSKMPFWRQASNHEAGEIKQYRDQVFKTTLDDGLNGVMGDPMDDSRFEAAAVNGSLAIRAQFVGADAKTVDAAVKGYVSGLEAARIAAVSEDNPRLADELIKGSPYLTPQDARKLRDSVRPKVELLRRQELVDGFVGKFGPDQEQDGVAYLRANYEGEEEERLVSAYRSRIGEMRVDENQGERLRALQQRENYNRLFTQYIANNKYPPAELTKGMLERGELSPDQWARLQDAGENLAERSQVERFVRAQPGANDLSPAEFDAAVMRKMGTTEEEYKRVFAAAHAGVMNGSVSDADLDYLYTRGKLATADVQKLKRLRGALTNAQQGFFKAENDSLNDQLKELEALGMPPELSQGARDNFSGAASMLDVHDPKYREKLFELKKAALLKALGKSGVALDGFWGRSSMGEKRDSILDARFDSKGVNPFPLLPSVEATPLDLAPRKEAPDIDVSIDAHKAANKGKRYQVGGKDAKSGGLDCSGLVCSAMGDMMKGTNKRLGYEAFGPEAQAAVKGFSADIIENVSKATGFEKVNPVLSDLRPGMIIGLDAGSGAGGRGYKGIDHVGVVVRGSDGSLKIYESNAKQGVVEVDAEKYLERYRGRGVPIYLVDPTLMMKKRPMTGKDGVFGIPSPPKREGTM